MEQTGAEYQQQAADGCGTYYNTAAFEHNYADISDVGGIELHNAKPELSYEEPIRDQRPKVIQESKGSRLGSCFIDLGRDSDCFDCGSFDADI